METLSKSAIGCFYTPRIVPLQHQHPRKSHKLYPSSWGGGSTTCSASKWAERLLSDFHFIGDSSSDYHNHNATATLAPSLPPLAPPDRHVSIPLDFYQVLGAQTHFLGDGIRRAYEARVSKPPQYGFSQDALVSRRQILQAACETLSKPSSRREYNQGLAEDEEGIILTQVPWDKVSLFPLFSTYNSAIPCSIAVEVLGRREKMPPLEIMRTCIFTELSFVERFF